MVCRYYHQRRHRARRAAKIQENGWPGVVTVWIAAVVHCWCREIRIRQVKLDSVWLFLFVLMFSTSPWKSNVLRAAHTFTHMPCSVYSDASLSSTIHQHQHCFHHPLIISIRLRFCRRPRSPCQHKPSHPTTLLRRIQSYLGLAASLLCICFLPPLSCRHDGCYLRHRGEGVQQMVQC